MNEQIDNVTGEHAALGLGGGCVGVGVTVTTRYESHAYSRSCFVWMDLGVLGVVIFSVDRVIISCC